MIRKPKPGPKHPLVEHWDDERAIGNGIIVTLIPGQYFYDDCGVMGFDTVREAKKAIADFDKAWHRKSTLPTSGVLTVCKEHVPTQTDGPALALPEEIATLKAWIDHWREDAAHRLPCTSESLNAAEARVEALTAEVGKLTKERDEARRKQYHIAAGRAICYVSKDGESVTDIYDIPVERMPNGYDYAEEIEAAEARAETAKAEVGELTEALEPFAALAKHFDHLPDDGGSVMCNVALSAIRIAAAIRSRATPTTSLKGE